MHRALLILLHTCPLPCSCPAEPASASASASRGDAADASSSSSSASSNAFGDWLRGLMAGPSRLWEELNERLADVQRTIASGGGWQV